MLKTITLLCFASQFLTIEAADPDVDDVVDVVQTALTDDEFESCRECAGTITNRMCKPDGTVWPNEESVVCCRDTVYDDDQITVLYQGNMDQEYCKPSETNTCSGTFGGSYSEESAWYAFCP